MKLLNYILLSLFVNRFNIFDIVACSLVLILAFTHSWLWMFASFFFGIFSQAVSYKLGSEK